MLETFAACESQRFLSPSALSEHRPGARVIYYFIGRAGREQMMEFGERQVR
jgi:hypothetical protein